MDSLGIRNLRVTFPVRGGSEVHALRGVDLDLAPGTTAIMGPSGSGKSTLLKALAGSLSYSGDIRAPEEGPWRSATVTQDSRLVEFLSVIENLQLGAESHGAPSDPTTLNDILAELEIEQLADRMPATLSGGQRQRAALARALASQAQLLLADEPTASLDSRQASRVAALLQSSCSTRQIIAVVATHDLQVGRSLDQIVRIRDGRIVG